ncbi:imelysin family protein [Marinovum sp.]|uniref:imelysin family protein n=1 Tax=Marinovum sp. TaxID=2024839 RepID=UPI002B265C1B|nr:imelysin family protein [Marinovum sp.]
MRALLTATLCLATLPALAGTREVVQDHALPRVAAFAEAAQALGSAAADDCRAATLRPAFQRTFDAWMGVSHLTLGPLEDDGRALTIAFWPDSRGLVGRAVQQMLAAEDAAVETAESFAEVSIAARGLFALERLLYEAGDAGSEGYACRFAQAIAADLARLAQETHDAWQAEFADQLLSAGDPDTPRFLTEREAAQALYTALSTGLVFTADQRLGRPMGSFDAARPQVAEARRSGRPLRNVILSLEALRDLARALADQPIPRTEAGFAAALETARDLDDPLLAGVAEPAGRFRVEALQTRVEEILPPLAAEIGAVLGVSVGFNASDGD